MSDPKETSPARSFGNAKTKHLTPKIAPRALVRESTRSLLDVARTYRKARSSPRSTIDLVELGLVAHRKWRAWLARSRS